MKAKNEIFIGSITGLTKEKIIKLLEDTNHDISNKRFNAIKLSIAPNAVNKGLLAILKKYNVSTIELEVQSTNDYILNRCGYKYKREEIKNAAKLIKRKRYNLSFQVGIGLPDSTKFDELNTARELAKLRPNRIRIYPMIVMKNTQLEKEFQNGRYEPLTVNQAVERCKEVVYEFNRRHIKQISIVKQNELNRSKETEIIAGPYHEEFGQLVTDSIWYDSIVDKIKKFNVKVRQVKIEVNPKELPNITGYKKENAEKLKELYDVDIKVQGNPDIRIGKSKITVLEVYSN